MTDAQRNAEAAGTPVDAGRPMVDPAAFAAPGTEAPGPAAAQIQTPPASTANAAPIAASVAVPAAASAGAPVAPAAASAAAPTGIAAPAPIPPLADVIAKPARGSSRGTSLLFVLAGAIAVGGIAFAAGRLTAPTATAAGFRGSGQLPGIGQVPRNGQIPADGQGFPGRGAFGGITIQGTVTEVTAEGITIALASGTTVTIPVDAATTYRAASPATSAAVTVGSEVSVTPGARVADPSASFDPNAAPGERGGMSFGAASTVTVVEP